MPYTLRMPEVAANATHATLVCWNRAEGERIESGQSIADVETDKAVLELPVEQGGVIGKLLVANGAQVPVGEPIAVLLQDGESLGDLAEQAAASGPAVATAATESDMAQATASSSVVASARVYSSPVARLLAKQNQIDLAGVPGTGPRGRVTKHDVVRHLQAVGSVSAAAPISAPLIATNVTSFNASGRSSSATQTNVGALGGAALARIVVPTATRRTIAQRLLQSKQEIPHFYLRARCDVEALLAARRQINAVRDVPLSINDFVVRAAAVALMQVPQMNVSWREDGIHEFDHADISVAVDTPNGLITPIVFDAGNKVLSVISSEIRALAHQAREGRLQPAQFQGGTFSVSNLGMYGVDEFDAIINPPQAGILAVGGVRAVPVARDHEVVVGRVMDVVLSADHRVVDGAVAARWLAAFRALIEQPLTMLV